MVECDKSNFLCPPHLPYDACPCSVFSLIYRLSASQWPERFQYHREVMEGWKFGLQSHSIKYSITTRNISNCLGLNTDFMVLDWSGGKWQETHSVSITKTATW
jgi:hypothetical protein